jgi:diguanylate cyclase (GGDEF)-like protein/PAS domain S-box-containing protein
MLTHENMLPLNPPENMASPEDQQLLQELRLLQANLARGQKQLKEAQLQLEHIKSSQADLYDAVPVGYLSLDEKGLVLDINRHGCGLLEREADKLLGKHFIAWLAEEERTPFLGYLREAFLDRGKLALELRVRTPAGILRDLRLESYRIEGNPPNRRCRLIMTDSSERRKADEASNLTARVIECAAEGIMITDAHGVIQSVNRAFEKSTGYAASEAIGRTPGLLRSGRHDGDFYREMWECLYRQGQWQGEIWNRNKSGEIYPEWLSITAIKDVRQRTSHYVGIFFDANTQAHIQQRLHYLAYYDGLTGLPNRRLFQDRLNLAISHARRNLHLLAVMFIDLDNFKQINDSLGHKFGDSLLTALTQRMKSCLREGDTLARLGGDEFTVLLPALADSGDAIHAARKILNLCAQPLRIEGKDVTVTASIGISIFPDDAEEADDLIDCADMAMYQIKEAGRNGYWLHRQKKLAKA